MKPRRRWWQWRPQCGGPVGAFFGIAVLCFFLALIFGCGTAATTAAPATVPATVFVPDLPDIVIDEPALATESALRSTSSVLVEQVAFDPIAYVNGLDYGWTEMDAAMEAFRVVALVRGWSDVAIDRWTPFVFDVIAKESGGCPNTVGGDIFVVGTCSEYQIKGHRSDSGMMQVTPVLYRGADAPICAAVGLCSQGDVVATPWASTLAGVVTLEMLGRYPWCDYEGAPIYHNCSLIGKDERPL